MKRVAYSIASFMVAIAAFWAVQASAADVVVNGVNLWSCTNYSDGCNTCTTGSNGQAACTMRQCFAAGTPKCLDVDDTSLEDLEKAETPVAKAPDFKLKKFDSCSNMETVVSDFIGDYYRLNPNRGGYFGGPVMMEDAVMSRGPLAWAAPQVGDSAKSADAGSSSSGNGGAKDFSQTNVQIAGVDESEIVKTDGSYAYYYNAEDHKIYVTDVRDPKSVSVVRKIKVPDSYGNPEIYVGSGKLVVFSSRYQTYRPSNFYWYDRSNKSVVVVYDIKDPTAPKIERYYQIDGSVSKSRRVGKYLYLLSTANFSFPYDNYAMGSADAKFPYVKKLDTAKIDRDFNAKRLMPKKIELSSAPLKNANFRQSGKLLPYRLESGDAATCAEVEYVLPDEATLAKYQFSPSFTTLSVIDLEDSGKRVKTKVLFGDVGEVFMSPTSLYLTSQLYSESPWRCPAFARCFNPNFAAGYETLVHKMDISADTAKYAATTVVAGTPLNQYSMDEGADGSFRIVTSEQSDGASTRVSVLGKDLSPLGTIGGIAKGETFRSSRFIGDKLYLVTFEQTDPLFVIDLKDAKNPKIEGELIMPGYSLYLHPYETGKLIGIGYDTKENQWGGVQNAGIKIDLYDVADVKNPKKLQSLVLGSVGSSTDAFYNPRLFSWNAAKKLLFLPATVMEASKNAADPYRYSGAFQGTVVVSIDAANGIKETKRITHIDAKGLSEKRKTDCAQYKSVETQPKCEKIIGGGEYCPPVSHYVPPYCYESSTDSEYFANQIWNFNRSFIARNIYLDDVLYSISNEKMTGHDMTNGYAPLSETVWKQQ